MFVTAYLPTEVELPQAVQHNANGEVAIIQFETYNGVTLQVIAEANEDGGMDVRLRGWGNIPAKVGNADKFTLNANIKLEEPTTCYVCYCKLGGCSCQKELE